VVSFIRWPPYPFDMEPIIHVIGGCRVIITGLDALKTNVDPAKNRTTFSLGCPAHNLVTILTDFFVIALGLFKKMPG